MPEIDESCPCGATVNPAYQSIEYIVDELLPEIIPDTTQRAIYLSLVLSFMQQTFDLGSLCANQRPSRPRDFTAFDWINPSIGAALAYDWLRYRMYELVCVCNDCPPITGCNQGECLTIGPGNGYYPDPDLTAVVEYRIPDGTWYVARSDGSCFGPFTGLYIRWHVERGWDPTLGMCLRNYNETGPVCWSQDLYSGTVVACVGGANDPPNVPWPVTTLDVEPFPGPPACTTSDICEALEYVYRTVNEIRFLTEVIAGPLYGITAPIAVTIPGAATPISGTLTEVLPRMVEALAPITPAQLANPTITPVTESSAVDVTGLAYVTIVPTAIPPTLGSWGVGATRVYYARTGSPSPGYVLVVGQSGILAYHIIQYDQGIEFVIPATATDLAIHLEPGVEIDITTYQRTV